MRHFKTTLAVIGGATILVLAGNTVTTAATGHSFLLGKSNSADANTSLTRTTSGSVLKLQSKSATNSPLTVNGKGKVANLNADSVDGFDSASLRNKTYVFTSTFTDKSSVSYNLPVAAGSYLVTVSNFFDGATATGIQCYIESGSDTTGWGAQYYAASTGWHPAESVTGYATKSKDSDINVECNTSGATWSTPEFPLTITATQTDIVKKATLTPSSGVVLKSRAQH